MGFMTNIEHESRVEVDVVKTTYKWYLSYWSLLRSHYVKYFESPPFDIMEGENRKCTLVFSPSGLIVIFRDDELPEVQSIRACYSFVDENMKKLYTSPGITIDSSPWSFDIEVVPDDCLQRDTLIVYFELWIVKAVHEEPSLSTNIVNTQQLNYSAIDRRTKFEEMFDSKQFCDVTFVVQEKKLKAHKLILSANSDVFKAMFTTDMQEEKEGLVKIEEVDAEVFEIFLRFMYTGKVENIDRIVTEIISVANRYQVMDLVRLCETYMKGHLSIDNAVQYLVVADLVGSSSLEDEAVDFLKGNTKILANPTEFKVLSGYPALIKRIFG